MLRKKKGLCSILFLLILFAIYYVEFTFLYTPNQGDSSQDKWRSEFSNLVEKKKAEAINRFYLKEYDKNKKSKKRIVLKKRSFLVLLVLTLSLSITVACRGSNISKASLLSI